MSPRIALSTILLFIGYSFSYGQDSHYWTQQYGTKSMLLSGSVIGGVEDLGAVYYNPGRLAVISNAAFLLSANVYESNSITVSDAFGSGKSASKSTIRGVPTLAAGTFRIKKLPTHFFAYAIMTRQSADLSFGFRGEEKADVIAALPGIETFGANIGITQNSTEQWIGLTWSHPISKKISVGITTNYSTNNQSRGGTVALQALSQDNKDVVIYRYNRSFSYQQSSLLWKAGLAADLGTWQLGLTVTTPMLKLSGSGSYTYEEFFSSSSAPSLDSLKKYSSSYQSGLNVNYKSPWSVGFGASRKIGRNKIHFSTEWFSSTPKYIVMQAADHISQSNPGDTISFHLVDQAKSVWNAGIGAEIFISEKVSGFASFSTDFTTSTGDIVRFAQRQNEASNSGWNVDFYHVGGGVVLKLKGADITLGATHTGASTKIDRPVNFPEKPGDPIFNSTDQADFRWDRWRLVFSFSFPFLRNYTDKLTGGGEKK
jgi:hypothetical protein